MTTSDSTSGVTAAAGSEYAWLPDHQLHVVATVARVHELLATMTEVVYDYVAPPGPLKLDTVPAGDLAQVVVTAVAAAARSGLLVRRDGSDPTSRCLGARPVRRGRGGARA